MIGETRHPLYITLHPPIGNGPYVKQYYDVTGKYYPLNRSYNTYINDYIKVKYVPLNSSPNDVLPENLLVNDITILFDF